MFNRIVFTQGRVIPLTLKWDSIRAYLFICCFISLGVLVPWICHQFHLAGPTFLPMHYFVLIAGLLFGWRVGLITGLLTPLASYGISDMPVINTLPQVVIELSAYGALAGLLREKLTFRMPWSLLGAMIGGRLALLLLSLIMYIFIGYSYSPVGVETGPLQTLWVVVKQGWPGILIQLLTIPIVIMLVEKYVIRGWKLHNE